jgi:putative transposase
MDPSWQDSGYVLGQFGKSVKGARRAYRRFLIEGISQGGRRELMGGGLIRSLGGWERVEELRRGRESWAYDERVLGSSEFVEGVLKEVEGHRGEKKVGRKAGEDILSGLAEKIGRKLGLFGAELTGGSRRRSVVEEEIW